MGEREQPPRMKNVDDLIESAAALYEQGLSRGEIADELNVSRETASWLVERGGEAGGSAVATDLEDVHVDWSTIGRDSGRLAAVGSALADLFADLGTGVAAERVALVVGIEKAGTPLATAVAMELDADLASYAPRKHHWEEGDIDDQEGGSFSRNFAAIEGRECLVVDDTITSGTTMTETIAAIEREGGTPVGCGVLADKRGVAALEGVPVRSLVQVIPVGREG
jgi:orotate phosphoribosyltransferase